MSSKYLIGNIVEELSRPHRSEVERARLGIEVNGRGLPVPAHEADALPRGQFEHQHRVGELHALVGLRVWDPDRQSPRDRHARRMEDVEHSHSPGGDRVAIVHERRDEPALPHPLLVVVYHRYAAPVVLTRILYYQITETDGLVGERLDADGLELLLDLGLDPVLLLVGEVDREDAHLHGHDLPLGQGLGRSVVEEVKEIVVLARSDNYYRVSHDSISTSHHLPNDIARGAELKAPTL